MIRSLLLKYAKGLKKLEKSWSCLLILGALCSCLSVVVFIQAVSLRKPAFNINYTNSVVIPEIQINSRNQNREYEPLLLQVVQHSRRLSFFKAREIAKSIIKISTLHKVDPLFVAAMIQEESRFKEGVSSDRGAIGLMQLKPSTASYVAQKNGMDFEDFHLLDREANIFLGISYLKYLSKKFNGNVNLILAAYNWGPGNVLAIRGDMTRLPIVTKRYVSSISSNYKKWKNVQERI